MQEVKKQWQHEKADHDRKIKAQAEELETQRQREKEAYEYNFAREKEQRENDLEDELQAIVKEIAVKRSDFKSETQQRTSELDNREAALIEREKRMTDLQNEVETFPELKETAVQAAVSATTNRLTQQFESNQALMKAQFDGEKNVLLGKIEALERTVASQAAQITDLSKKSEQAYEKVQDIANRAVTASRREPYPVPAPVPPVPVRDDG
jgi:hypothetical protein